MPGVVPPLGGGLRQPIEYVLISLETTIECPNQAGMLRKPGVEHGLRYMIILDGIMLIRGEQTGADSLRYSAVSYGEI